MLIHTTTHTYFCFLSQERISHLHLQILSSSAGTRLYGALSRICIGGPPTTDLQMNIQSGTVPSGLVIVLY